jgi:hypothetical protein
LEQFRPVGDERGADLGRLEDQLEDLHRFLPHPIVTVEREAEEKSDNVESVRGHAIPQKARGLSNEIVFAPEPGSGKAREKAGEARVGLGIGNGREVERHFCELLIGLANVRGMQHPRQGRDEAV